MTMKAAIITAVLVSFGWTRMNAAQQTVEQWGTYEISLNGPANGNPFLDVAFSASFTLGNSTEKVNGFYDGDGIYRVRFMPMKQGEWHYVTESTSSELNGETGTFT